MLPAKILKGTLHLVFIFIAGLFFTPAFCQTLDSSFGIKGKQVIINPTNYLLQSRGFELQPNGKIIVRGQYSGTSDDYWEEHFVFRCNEDGSYDSSFKINYVAGYLGIYTALQNDGKIVIGATSSDGHGDYIKAILYRVNEDGTTDPSFNFTESFNDGILRNVHLQSTGKSIISGALWSATDTAERKLVRFSSDGSVDASFGTNGSVYASTAFEDYAGIFKIFSNDEIVLSYKTGIAKYTADGKLDSSFGANGIASFLPQTGGSILDILVLHDGKLLLPVYISSSNKYYFYRFNADGSADETFGTNGSVELSYGLAQQQGCIAIADDGKILASLSTPFSVARFMEDGSIDQSFGSNGIYDLNFSDYDSMPGRYTSGLYTTSKSTLTIQPDNKVIFLSSVFDTEANDYYQQEKPALARFINDESNTTPSTTIAIAAFARQEHISLKWLVTRQQDIVNYSIQRTDGNTGFITIGKVKRTGAGKQQYSFNDNDPVNGKNYYKLKVIHQDGSVTFSDTVAAKFTPSLLITIAPNPVHGVLNIHGLNANTQFKLSVVRANGSVAKTIIVKNRTEYTWNLNDLTNGVYTLLLESMNTKQSIHFIKE